MFSRLISSKTQLPAMRCAALYCDGGSWAGNAVSPVMAKPNSSAPAQKIFYRGRPLLDALYDHLLAAGLHSASELLFAGCSAGGLTVYRLSCSQSSGLCCC